MRPESSFAEGLESWCRLTDTDRMIHIAPELFAAASRRSSFVERLGDALGINRLFLRRGSPPAISTDAEVLVSPAQSRTAWVGSVRGDELLPAKPILRRPVLWSLSQILWDESLAGDFEGGVVFNLYLSPTDLHYLIAPVDATVESVRRHAGRCWPIVFWKLGEIENERVVVLLRLADGRRWAMVLVGSFLVSGVLFLPRPGEVVRKGEVIGGFKAGSTVFLAFGPDQVSPQVETGDRLLLGEPVARLLA